MTRAIFLTVFFVALTGHAEYASPMRELMDGKSVEFKKQVWSELKLPAQFERKHQLLKLLTHFQEQFYHLSDFSGQVIALNEAGSSEKAAALRSPKRLGAYEEFEFFLEPGAVPTEAATSCGRPPSQFFGRPPGLWHLSVRRKGIEILRAQPRARTRLKNPYVRYGVALHLIINRQDPGTFYMLVREIESAKLLGPSPSVGEGLSQVADGIVSGPALSQTLVVYRFNRRGPGKEKDKAKDKAAGTEACEVASADMSEDDRVYELLAELIRSYGPVLLCESPIRI